ncbi:ESSS domain-containing protein [Cephalotus follicularis]|uniref:ESSS domain-containing protein n=1 Tax=Cephalotus follicularis TaxID=3775 RepID=A0A1Q3B7P3_CEPFO|nr:ESSS domain-containing protein [Cephalotus follicularis]
MHVEGNDDVSFSHSSPISLLTIQQGKSKASLCLSHSLCLRYQTPATTMTFASILRQRLMQPKLLTRGGATDAGPSRWRSPGHEDRPKGYFLNRTPPPAGQPRKWEDWELPCYITSFLTIVILGVGLNAKPDLTIETWAHKKALERLEMEAQKSE